MKVKELIGELMKCENLDVDVRVWDGAFGVHLDVTGAKYSSYDPAGREPVMELYVDFCEANTATPSVTDQRYDQLWSFIGEANKPEELTEFGQGIRTAFEYMCEDNSMDDVDKYWDEIKAKSYKKKKYKVEVTSTDINFYTVLASTPEEAREIAMQAAVDGNLDEEWQWENYGIGDIEEVKE